MSVLRLLAMSLLVLGTSSSLVAQDKKAEVSKEKLVGIWESVKGDEGTIPPGSTMELGKDGKVKITAKLGDKIETVEGTWTLTGDKFTLNVTVQGNEHKTDLIVKQATGTELTITDDKGKSVAFKKK
jgi:uncharacterized protein (TIGR03066 family)